MIPIARVIQYNLVSPKSLYVSCMVWPEEDVLNIRTSPSAANLDSASKQLETRNLLCYCLLYDDDVFFIFEMAAGGSSVRR